MPSPSLHYTPIKKNVLKKFSCERECVCLGVGYTCDKIRNPLIILFHIFLGAGESGKSTIVNQMK